jgi:Kef-type K+ transport system membrane component KefB
VAATVAGLLTSAVITEAIGIHALFGAFLFGAMIPATSLLARATKSILEPFVSLVLLPIFFAASGLRTQIGLLDSWHAWVVCGVIILVATLGKAGGTIVAARLGGLAWRPSAALGALMNTRGLMELVVLTIGADLGVITPTLFTMMVIMAVVTTIATTPLLTRLLGADFADGDLGTTLSLSQRRVATDAVSQAEQPTIVSDVEQAGDFSHPAADYRRRGARGVQVPRPFDL